MTPPNDNAITYLLYADHILFNQICGAKKNLPSLATKVANTIYPVANRLRRLFAAS